MFHLRLIHHWLLHEPLKVLLLLGWDEEERERTRGGEDGEVRERG
jgi:hypothetical protein